MVLEKTLESPLDCKEIQPVHSEGDQGISLEGMMLKLKLQYFGHLMGRVDSLAPASLSLRPTSSGFLSGPQTVRTGLPIQTLDKNEKFFFFFRIISEHS